MPEPEGPKPQSNMRLRVITAAIGIPIVLAVLCARSPLPLQCLIGLLFAIGVFELATMVRTPLWVMLTVAVAGLAPVFFVPTMLLVAWPMFGVGLVGLIVASPTGKLWGPLAVGWLAGPLLMLASMQALWSVCQDKLFAPNIVLLAVVPVWAGDTAAIFAGRAFGKTPLAPKISPKKTVEGSVANLIACILAALALSPLLHISLVTTALCGAACGTFGQIGDLLESALKRRFDVKDSGTILPGHGGVLDRIDSLLMTALPVATILMWGK